MFNWIKKLFTPQPDRLSEILTADHVILDVRTNDEFKSGHIKGAVHIPLDQVQKNMDKIKKFGKPVVAYCRSGNRSGMACGYMTSAGITCANGGGYEQMRARTRG